MDKNRMEASEGLRILSKINGLPCRTDSHASLNAKGNFPACRTTGGRADG